MHARVAAGLAYARAVSRARAGSIDLLALAGSLGASAASPQPVGPGGEPAAPPPKWTPPVTHALTMFVLTRSLEAALYPEPFARVSTFGAHYGEALTQPPLFDTSAKPFEWDGDPWWINVVGHGLMGSELYLRARTCRFGAAGAFLFAAGGTLLWEYGFEANGVRPSALDLVYTPLFGSIAGELRWMGWRAARGTGAARAVARALLDPFGEIERAAGLPC